MEVLEIRSRILNKEKPSIPLENQLDTARVAGGPAPVFADAVKKDPKHLSDKNGGFQLDQPFELVLNQPGQRVISYDSVPLQRNDMVDIGLFNTRVEANERKAGQYFLWNEKSLTIRAYSNSGWTLAFEGGSLQLRPYADED